MKYAICKKCEIYSKNFIINNNKCLYCRFCYLNTKLKKSHYSIKDFQYFIISKMRKKGISKLVAWIFTRSIPKLK